LPPASFNQELNILPHSRENSSSTIKQGVNSSFRVENRRARPKIIKNVNNICNIFIF
jgi:hypothetical protein